MTALPTPRGTNDLEEGARVRDLAFEMLAILDIIGRNEVVMDMAISSATRARIRRVLKEAHGE